MLINALCTLKVKGMRKLDLLKLPLLRCLRQPLRLLAMCQLQRRLGQHIQNLDVKKRLNLKQKEKDQRKLQQTVQVIVEKNEVKIELDVENDDDAMKRVRAGLDRAVFVAEGETAEHNHNMLVSRFPTIAENRVQQIRRINIHVIMSLNFIVVMQCGFSTSAAAVTYNRI